MSASSPQRTPTESPQHPPAKLSRPALLALGHINTKFSEIFQSAAKFEKEHPDEKEALARLFRKFFTGLNEYRPHLLPPSLNPTTPDHTAEMENVKEALTSMQKTLATLQSRLAPTHPINTLHQPMSSMPAPIRTPSQNLIDTSTMPNPYNSNPRTPPRPSIVVHVNADDITNHPAPHTICSAINNSLQISNAQHVHISSASWSMKENLVLTGGHTNTV